MSRRQLIGVSSTVRENQINHLNENEQDMFIRDVAGDLETKLRRMVHDRPPLGDLAFHVRGPFQDPIQGTIHVHTMTGYWDLDALPIESDAYRIYVTDQPQTEQGNQP